jgi:probable HAF family extracellular repeat protein
MRGVARGGWQGGRQRASRVSVHQLVTGRRRVLRGLLGELPRSRGGGYSQGLGVNDRGQVVGTSVTAGGQSRAFFWEKGRMTDLGTNGQRSSGALDINSRGQIVGGADGIPTRDRRDR